MSSKKVLSLDLSWPACPHLPPLGTQFLTLATLRQRATVVPNPRRGRAGRALSPPRCQPFLPVGEARRGWMCPPSGLAPGRPGRAPLPPRLSELCASPLSNPFSKQTYFLMKWKPDLCCQQVSLGFASVPPLRPSCPHLGRLCLCTQDRMSSLSDLLTPRLGWPLLAFLGVRCQCYRAVFFLKANTVLEDQGPHFLPYQAPLVFVAWQVHIPVWCQI